MASVTFLAEIGGDGTTVSDDTNPETGLRRAGYLTRFVPALTNIINISKRIFDLVLPVSRTFLPPSATDPLLKPDGTPLTNGLQYYNTTTNKFRVRKSGVWSDQASSAVGGGDDKIFYLSDQIMTASYTIPQGKNAVTGGPLTIPAGITLTALAGTNVTII